MPLYVGDYGKENIKLIKDRIKKTVYIFDSLPVHEINFLTSCEDFCNVDSKLAVAIEECRDFIKKKKNIDEKDIVFLQRFLEQEIDILLNYLN